MTYYARVRRVHERLRAELSGVRGCYVEGNTIAELRELLIDEISASRGASAAAEAPIYFELPEDPPA